MSEPRNALRFGVAFSVGALVGLLVFVAVSTRGTFDLAESVPYTADFYDVQAERLLDGGWDMPRDLLAVEGYAHDGKMFMYFAPGPALLRAPFVAVFGSPDGEWSRAWMIAASVLALAGLGVLAWQIRRLAGVDATVGVLDMVLAAALALTMSAGSSLLFLLSGPWVYHEALLWAVAATLAAFAALLVWIERPRAWLLAAAGGLSVLAILSRLTVGSAPAIALAMTAAVVAAARVVPPVRDGLARLAGLDHRHVTWRSAAVAAIGSASSFASYAWTNSQKFDSPFGYPLEKYQLFKLVPRRREILVENGGTLLHLDALPTTLVQYFRPDAFALDSGFPWIGAPRWRPDVVGDRTFEVLDRSASLSATMPVIVVLAAVGVVAVVVARGRSARLAAVRIPLVASALAATPVLVFIAVTQRYSGDLLPVLFVAALAGLYAIRSRIRAPAPHPWLLGALAVTLAALAGWGVLANYGIARDYQRGHLPPVDGEGQSADAISSGSGRVGAVAAPLPRIR